jgi:hypothetical protein
MFIQLFIASVMVLVTVLVHLTGIAVLVRILRSHHWLMRPMRVSPLALLLGASLGIFAIHTVEIWLYALLYLRIGASTDFEQALYFSTVTDSTVGYGDLLLAKDWRILGAIEGTTGIIMLGWSTAFLVSLLAQLKLFAHDWLTPDRERDDRKDSAQEPKQ